MSAMVSSQPTTIADVAELLKAEYRSMLSPSVVSDVVLLAGKDLDGQTPGGALPEMLFRLARVRLTTMFYAMNF